MTQPKLHSHDSLDLVPGLDVYEVDKRCFRANVASDVAQRTLAFYLFDLKDRDATHLLGYRTAKDYAMERLDMPERRANEMIQAGKMLHDLVDVDKAFLEGRISWSKVLTLMSVARTSNQDTWLERATKMSCRRLKKAVAQANNGKKVTGESESGLPQPMYDLRVAMDMKAQEELEELRQHLMRKHDRLVTDSEILAWLMAEAKGKIEVPDEEKDAARRLACEDKETPDWLRREVLARDGYECTHCSRRGKLHVHHIIFRENGGRTSADNLMALCLGCHGMVHSGFLRIVGEAPRGLKFLDRHGNPLVPPAQAREQLLNVVRFGGRPPETDIPDPITTAWIDRNPRIAWSWSTDLRVLPGATEWPTDYEEVPDGETAEWINRQPQLEWIDGEGLRILLPQAQPA